MAKITNEIGYRNMDPNGGNDLFLELNLESDSTSSTHRTLSFSTGWWQRWGRWGFDSYISIGYYNYTGASRDTMYANIGAYESSWVRWNSTNASFYTQKAVDGSGNWDADSEWHEYYEPKLSVSIPFERKSSDYYVMLAGYSSYQDCTVLSDWYLIPAKQLQPDTFVAQSQWDIIYCPMGGTYSGATQIKIKNTNLTLNSEIPVRTGFSFNEWNTAIDGSGNSYSPGDSYTQNEPLMLFAQWTKKISLDSLKYVSWPHFKNFITSIKSKLKPNNLSAYVIKEGIFKTIHNDTTMGTDIDWWWQYRHWSDGIAEAWGCGLGQTSTGSSTTTSLYTRLPKNIFVDHPIVTMSIQSNDRDGVWPTYVNPHTITSDDNPSDPNDIGLTYIDNYIDQDGGDNGKGKNYWVKYYVRGRWGYKATIANDTSTIDDGTYNYVKYNNIKYFTPGASFIFKPGETLTLRSIAVGTGDAGSLYVDGTQISSSTQEQTWELPLKDISIKITITSNNSRIDITTL